MKQSMFNMLIVRKYAVVNDGKISLTQLGKAKRAELRTLLGKARS